MQLVDDLIYYLASFIAVIFVITTHEFAHAYAAYKCGDATAKYSGRMTLNPVKHFDPIGILMFAFVGFGWAKPVPVNPYNFKNYKTGSVFTSIAGVAVNYLCAFLAYPLFILTIEYVYPLFVGKYMGTFLIYLVQLLYIYSLTFCVFNLLPLYPLDGFRLLDASSNRRGRIYQFLRQYGYYILLGLIVINLLASRIGLFYYINVLGHAMNLLRSLFSRPILLFWNLFF